MSQFVARLHVVDTFRVCCRFAAPVVDVAGDRRLLLFFGVAVEQEGQIGEAPRVGRRYDRGVPDRVVADFAALEDDVEVTYFLIGPASGRVRGSACPPDSGR